MRDLKKISWPPEHSCKVSFQLLKELREDSMEIPAKAGGKNYTREEDKGIEI